jgi:hypothetical protein
MSSIVPFPEIESREEKLLRSLLIFYRQDPQHIKDLAAISCQKTIISLREMDFTVTNYSKKNKVHYKLPNGELFRLHLDYKSQLRGHSKKQFDPFCRVGDKKKDPDRLGRMFLDFETMTPIFIETKDEIETYKNDESGVVTTVGQLNFFRWAINNKVVEYCFNNKESIVEQMDEECKKKKAAKKESKGNPKDTKEPQTDESTKVVIEFP